MRTSRFSVSKQLPITSVVSPSPQLAVIEQLERRSALLSAAESCRILDMHPKTLYERLRSGELKGIKAHRKWKIDPRNLAEYIRRSELTRKNTDHRDCNPPGAQEVSSNGARESFLPAAIAQGSGGTS